VKRARNIAGSNENLQLYCKLTSNCTNGNNVATTEIKDSNKPKWNFHWATVITSLGTKEKPSKVLIEIFQCRSIMDSRYGKVELVLLDYADKKRHSFWKKIEKDSLHLFQSELVPELQILLVFDVDMRTKLNKTIKTEEIDYFIYPLKNKKMTIKIWNELCHMCKTPGFDCEFKNQRGIHWIYFSLAQLLFKKENPDPDNVESDDVLQYLLLCLERLKSHTTIMTTYFVKLLFQTLAYVSIIDKIMIFYILGEVCADKERNKLVIDGIRYFMAANVKDFKNLKDELNSGDHLPFKIRFIGLINATISSSKAYGLLDTLRDEYFENGLTAQFLTSLGEAFPDEELQDQINIFIETAEFVDYKTNKDCRTLYHNIKDELESQNRQTTQMVAKWQEEKKSNEKNMLDLQSQIQELKKKK